MLNSAWIGFLCYAHWIPSLMFLGLIVKAEYLSLVV